MAANHAFLKEFSGIWSFLACVIRLERIASPTPALVFCSLVGCHLLRCLTGDGESSARVNCGSFFSLAIAPRYIPSWGPIGGLLRCLRSIGEALSIGFDSVRDEIRAPNQ